MTVPLEKTIVNNILRYLNSLRVCRAIKIHGSGQRSGEADVLCCFKGKTIMLEVKRPGGAPTALQLEVLELWNRAGAITGVVTSVDEVKELLQKEGLI